MFRWFKSKEQVTIVPCESDCRKLSVYNAEVTHFVEDFLQPGKYTICFTWRGENYVFGGVELLTELKKVMFHKRPTDKVYFSTLLTIVAKKIAKVEWNNTVKGGM
jgi:hypothetical protein